MSVRGTIPCRVGLAAILAAMAAAALLPHFARAAGREEDKMEPAKKAGHPCLACTPDELARLQAAWKGGGPAHEAVAARIGGADRALRGEILFPPRGGQHNQWYQCDACQTALKTVDATHHQCPRCGKVYSGEPYDDVLYERQHYDNVRCMADAAWAHAITGDAKYAEYAKKVLLGYAERYAKYPYHDAARRDKGPASASGGHLFEQTLNEAAELATRLAPACDLIWNSDALTDRDRETIRTGLLGPMLQNIAKHRAGKSNWQTWHNAALFAGGVMMNDEALTDRSVNDPANGFLFQMRACVSKEGMWYENSWGYHFYTLTALVTHAEAARRFGLDLWSHEPLKKMFLLPAQYVMADGALPRFGDDVSSSPSKMSSLMEAGYRAYGDPAILALLPAKPGWESILYGRDVTKSAKSAALGSAVFPDAGHAILRTHGPAGLTAAMSFGPYGGFHGHLDKLSFVFFGWGQELGVDPGRAASQAYRLPIHTLWYKATLSHNAVLVDRATQAPATGRLLAFKTAASYTAAAAACEEAYKGVAHRRLLCLTPAYLLVADELSAEADRRFTWVYHNRGGRVTCEGAREAAAAEKDFAGLEYVRNMKAGRTDDAVRAVFADAKIETHLTAARTPGTDVRVGDGVGASVDDHVPVLMLERRGKRADFAVVIEPVAAGKPPTVKDVALERRGKELVLTVTGLRGKDTVTWDGDAAIDVRPGSEGTDK